MKFDKIKAELKKNKTILLIFILIIASVLSYVFVISEAVYDQDGWLVKYPKSWKLRVNVNDGLELIIPDGGKMSIISEKTDFSDIYSYESFFENNINLVFNNVDFINKSDMLIDGVLSKAVIYDIDSGSRVLQVYNINNGKGTLITYSALQNVFDKNVETVKKVIDTVRIGV